MTGQGREKFDGLGRDYDRYRPRYPSALFDAVVSALPAVERPWAIDTGAGTGVALEGLLRARPDWARLDAVDVSSDMVARGREKFPQVEWHVGAAEPFLESNPGAHLILAAQAYQWMDRPRYVRAAADGLAAGGVVAIMQNDRDFTVNRFLDAYEGLLEELSPGYSRFYRTFDIGAELGERFATVEEHRVVWEQRMRADDFVGMSQTSTQVQRAITAHGGEFLRRLEELVGSHAVEGELTLTYTSKVFTATSPHGAARSS